MNFYKHSTKKAFMAWLLLVVFALPMVVKTLHVCHLEEYAESSQQTSVSAQHAVGHNADDCQICHFAFFSFLKADTIYLGTIVPILISIALSFYAVGYYRTGKDTLTLRGPPVYALV